MRLTDEQRQQVTELKDSLDRSAGWLAELALATGRRDFVMASSQVQGSRIILMTILTEDKDLELNGPQTPQGPQLVGKTN